MLLAAYLIGFRALKNHVFWSTAVLAFIATFALKLPYDLNSNK